MLWAGCRRQPGPNIPGQSITIVVLQNGQPVTVGQVDLSGQGGGASLNEMGEAKFKHVPFGQYRVMVIPPEPAALPTETGGAPPSVKSVSNIPLAYRAEETTPLTIDVQPTRGEILFQFELKPSS